MSANWEGSGYPGVPMGVSASSNVWSSRVQWGAILAGGLAGFGVVILMTTLGAALGITAGTIGAHNTDNPTGDTAEKVALAFGIGSGVWMLLTALASGLIGGYVLNTTSRRDRPYSPFVFGGIAWTIGVCTMLMVASPAFGGALSGIGSGAGGAVAGIAGNPEVQRRVDQAQAQKAPPVTEEEKATAADAARKAAKTATAAAWMALLGQLIGLGATIFAAGWHRDAKVKVVTELRPRPAPVS